MILLVLFGGLIAVPILLAAVLNTRALASVRETLAQSKYRRFAYALPFSPAATMSLFLMWRGTLQPIFALLPGTLGMIVGPICCSAFAAVWLCIPDRSERRIAFGYSVLLTIVLWLLGSIALGVVGYLSVGN